ncbi:MAG: ATPase domain-containing protein [Blastocatellia bacterium]
MSKDDATSAEKIVSSCGGYTNAVQAIMNLGRALWDISLTESQTYGKTHHKGSIFRKFYKKDLLDKLAPSHREQSEEILNTLHAKHFCWEIPDEQLGINLNIFQPYLLVRTLLADVKDDHELRYSVMRNIRQHYHCVLTSQTAHLFHLLGNAVSSLNSSSEQAGRDAGNTPDSKPIDYVNRFVPFLSEILKRDFYQDVDPQQYIKLFVECCREVGYLRANYKNGYISLRTNTIDTEYLFSHLFGITTGIRGFDELFGGGGLILADNLEGTGFTQNGRTILIRGSFGTGKTLLSLQLAVEVARKGGLAWVMPLEQSPEECLYTLESMQALPKDQSVLIADSTALTAEVLQKKNNEQGALVILKTIKDSYNDFLIAFVENAKQMDQYPLRLISVDPLNSIHRDKIPKTQIRAQTLAAIEDIERAGTNVLLVAEEGADPERELLSEQNIADTVVRLSLDKRYGYAYRYFEVKKSRLQREQRGEHPFSILSGKGIKILPSSAAVRARMRPRSIREPDTPTTFGLPSLDVVLRKNAIRAGDVIVFQGAGGSFKTPLGIFFLLGSDDKSPSSGAYDEDTNQDITLPRRSLLVAALDSESTVRHLLKQELVQQHISMHKTPKKDYHIRICSIPSGYVNPGYIFQRIEDELKNARLKGYWIDRIMVDDISHWEMSCPAIRNDDTFGDTLIDFLRRHGVTSLLACGEVSPDMYSSVQRSIIDGADCAIKFDQFEFRGVNRVMIRVLKSRGMRHLRESFEIALGPKTLDVKPSSSLLRVTHDGEVEPVKIRLFMHSETEMQNKYNERFLNSMAAVLSRDIELDLQNLILRNGAVSLDSSSAIDELQVLQIDEFQLPNITDSSERNLSLYKFSSAQWEEEAREWGDFEPRLLDRCLLSDKDKSFFAVPLYGNVSLMAYKRSELNETATTSWEALAMECVKWERRHKDTKALFFDFPRATEENYNCLFFEILLSFEKRPERSGLCDLRKWLRSDAAVKAGKIYRRLCRRAHFQSERDSSEANASLNIITVNPEAVVWRHWYSTLNQMLYGLLPEARSEIEVRALPGGIAIAGEWYLGVPAYSAAPDVGLGMIKLLTTHEAELDRLRLGIGLPTRSTFYEVPTEEMVDTGISPYFSIEMEELTKLIKGAFRRSDFGCYSSFSNVLAYYLQRIIEIPDGSKREVEKKIKNILRGVETRMDFLRSAQECNNCRIGSRGHIVKN